MSENSTKYNDFMKRMGGGSAHQQTRGSGEMAQSQYSEFSGRNANLLQNQKKNDEKERTQEDMWAEFHSHFGNKGRDRGKPINHHDFLDAGFLPTLQSASRKNFFSKVGGQQVGGKPFESNGTASVDLGYERLVQARKNYMKL